MFYVYEHIRKDTNQPFYVGKGQNKRANSIYSRNRHWNNIVKKADGFDVNYVIQNIDEELALLVEIELIDVYKRRGIALCNMTNGGEGVSGLTHKVSEKQKRLQSERMMGNQYAKGLIVADYVKKAVIESNKRRRLTGEHKEKLTFKGMKHTEEHKQYIKQKMIGRVFSEETKRKMSEAQKKRWSKNYAA